ncbi:hypothetical protein Mal48_30860 [Thalassoglobus polymorphus]|uniref:Uncharacterized protein n=1 Tax=Thalassoglobus polymorphus TaxID=2527994 RepID=A0A517QQC3_9PLAN|nr:hypothetical protein Mal48_30860 [Thalassoglobus polymorphus]
MGHRDSQASFYQISKSVINIHQAFEIRKNSIAA